MESSAIKIRIAFPGAEVRNRDDGAVVPREMMRIIKVVIVHLAIIQRRLRRLRRLWARTLR